jgi:hypothetical protein
MKMSPATRISAAALSVASLFALLGLIPSPQVSGATPTTTAPTHIVLVAAPKAPKWYAPIFALGPKARAFFTCVIHAESRSTWKHPKTHDGDPAYPGQYGIFQFTWPSQNNAWDAYVLPTIHVEPRYASAYQQAEGAAIIWKMGDEKQVWSLWDGCWP